MARQFGSFKCHLSEARQAGSSSNGSSKASSSSGTETGAAAQKLEQRCAESTAETVRQLQPQHLETVTSLQHQKILLQALIYPHPPPTSWTLSLETENSTYFTTEGTLNPSNIANSQD